MFYYEGKKLYVPESAEIYHNEFGGSKTRRRPPYAALVQEALDELALENRSDPLEWVGSEPEIFTLYDVQTLPLYVLERDKHEEVVWGYYRFHTAKAPKLSPFVFKEPGKTNSLTIELVGTPKGPALTRVYAGEYAPPLPWQKTADDADGGRMACLDFWKTHAFALHKNLVTGNLVDSVPDWAR